MQQLLLSICIPTYNRSEYLEYLLKNIISQLNENNLWDTVEICISDNASTDNTEDIVNKYKLEYPKIIYRRNSQNVGFDRNLLQSVAISHGVYCWLFGSDDRFEENGIVTAIKCLDQHPGISGMTVNVQNYNHSFSKKVRNPKFRTNKDYIGSDASDIYIKLGQYFSFISGQIINRQKWDEVINNNDLSKYYNGYIHLYMAAKIVYNSPQWVYISKMLVGWREGNDSALNQTSEGYIKRLRLDYAYFDIAKDVFGSKTWVYYCHANQVCGQFIFCNLQNIKANTDISIAPLFFEITSKFWVFPNYYLKLLPVFILPKSVLNFIKKLKRILRNLLGK